jgi:hypothetical protein
VTAFVDQVPALAGVALGAFATIIATTFAERMRWRRDQAVRWDERRLEAYREYAAAIKTMHALTMRLAANEPDFRHSRPVDPAVADQLLDETDARRTAMWESVLLLGDAATVNAARQWWEAVRNLEIAVRRGPRDPAAWEALLATVNDRRDGFYVAARNSLGVRGGDVGQSRPLRTLPPLRGTQE